MRNARLSTHGIEIKIPIRIELVYKQLERKLPEPKLDRYKKQGKTDAEIAQLCGIEPADVLLLRGWYGIKPLHIKSPPAEPDPNRKPRLKRKYLDLIRDLRRLGLTDPARHMRRVINEEIYTNYKNGHEIQRLSKLYEVPEKKLTAFIDRRDRLERVRATEEYKQARGKELTPQLLKQYKEEGKADTDIGILHGLNASAVCQLRKKLGIAAVPSHMRDGIGPEKRTAIIMEYRAGTSIGDICEKFGINQLRWPSFCSHYLTADDKALRQESVYDSEGQKKELRRLQEKHKTDAAIGKVLGISRQRVHQIRIRLGIPPLEQNRKPEQKR